MPGCNCGGLWTFNCVSNNFITMNKRELVQAAAVEHIRRCDYTGALVIAPRVGKSKIVVDAIGEKFFRAEHGGWGGAEGIFIAAPYRPIASNWHKELLKWGGIHCDATTLCFPSLKKIATRPKLLVVDEWHELSANQMDAIKKLDPERLLLVTGTANEYSRAHLKFKLGIEVGFEYAIEEAIRDGIIANFHVYIVKVPLNESVKCHKVNGVPATERQSYDYHTALFDDLRIKEQANPGLKAAKEAAARRRSELLYGVRSKFKVAKRIANEVNERLLIFTARTAMADKLSPYSYHSKNKKAYLQVGEEKAKNNLDRFIDEEINTLAVVKMTDMGITFPDLKTELVHQLQSNSEDSLQKFLRACNLEDEKKAKIIITVCKDTMDEAWAMEAMKGVPSEKITWLELGGLEGLLNEF